MGTRSTTIIMDRGAELVRIYRQYDGYPDGHGVQLAKLCDVQIVNGFGSGMQMGTQANGMGCLAAQIIAGLKESIGNVYIVAIGGEINDWCEYVYIVRNKDGVPEIECTTQTGEFPFNTQEADAHVFTGTAKEWLARDWEEAAE